MPYSTNPHLPKVRMRAVLLVRGGWSIRKVARYVGVEPSTVLRWVRRAPSDGRSVIPTRSSRPHHHPRALKPAVVHAIIVQRLVRHRCAEVIHRELALQGVRVSLSSVKRTLKRQGLLRERNPWKRWHRSEPRPEARSAGDLVEIDTIHVVPREGARFYVYTLLDVASRWAYAKVVSRINTHQSLAFIREAQACAPFRFQMLQSDHGSEFSTWFSERVRRLGVCHRHSRVRQPNDNGHLERFNRTLQEEGLRDVLPDAHGYQEQIATYLPYYNNDRLHMGLGLKTPLQVLRRY